MLDSTSPSVIEQLRLALEAGGMGTWRWDLATGLTVLDARMEELLGLGPGEFDGSFEGWVARLHPDDRDATLRAVEDAIEDGGTYRVEHRVRCDDGSVRWIEGRGKVTFDVDGDATGSIGCAWDVTERVETARQRQAALAELERARQRDVASRQRLEFLSRINDALAGADQRDDIMRSAAFAAVPRLGDWCAIAVLPSDDSDVPIFEVAHADPTMVSYARELQERFPYDPDASSGVAKVIRTGAIEFVPEIDEGVIASVDTTDEGRDVLRQLALRSWIIVPLLKGERVLGAMQFVNSSLGRPYTLDDVTLAEAAASRIASALENRRLADELRRNEFRAALDALLDDVAIARAVRDERGEIVDFVIEFMNAHSVDGAGRRAAELLGARVCDVYPKLRESGLFDRYVGVIEKGEPLILDRVRYEDVTPDGTAIEGWWSLRVVPFGDGYLASSRDETRTVLAEQQLQAARETQVRTRLAMEVLQAAALPASLPESEQLEFGVRYETANDALPVGGDWYDVFDLPAGSGVAVVVADVAGHGLEAAGAMLQVRNALRAYALDGDDPDVVLRRSNALLCAATDGGPFVTCAYAVVEPDRGRIRWSSAGHPPPALRRGDHVELLAAPPGLPLGVDPSARYTTAVADLRRHDTVVMFTDGLIERRDESIDAGLARLAEHVAASSGHSAQSLVDRLVEHLMPGERRSDDVAVVAFHVT